MTTKEKISLIQNVVNHKLKNDKNMEDFDKVFNSFDFPISNEYYCLLDDYIELVEEQIGDKCNWVSWFIFDNDCGKKNFVVEIDGKEYKIDSIKKLVKHVLNNK